MVVFSIFAALPYKREAPFLSLASCSSLAPRFVALQSYFSFRGSIRFVAGKYSDEVNAGHLIIPRKVHENGTFLSHNLTHHHDINSLDSLHYRIDLAGESLHLELE